MLDPIHCNGLPQEKRPRLALAALWELLELVRTQQLCCAGAAAQTESTDAPKTQNRLLSEQFYLPQEGPVGKVSRTQSRSLPPTGRAVTALRGVQPKTNREAK
jgi:hypothetical protein